MKRSGNFVNSGLLRTIFLITAVFVVSIGFSAASDAATTKSGSKTAKKTTAAKKPAAKKTQSKTDEVSNSIGDSLRKGKSVFVYFYSTEITDSLDQLDAVKKAAKKGNADVVTVKTEDAAAPYNAYDGQYIPTVLLLRPEAGLTNYWEMDLPEDEMTSAVESKAKPNDKQKQLAEAIKNKKPALLFFMAKWCGYCQKLLPEVKSFEKDYGKCVDAVTVDVDDALDMQEPYMINGVPILVLFDANGFARLRTGYPNGYDRYKQVFEGMSETTKSCMKASKSEKSGDQT